MTLARWSNTVQDAAGNAVAGCEIEVRSESTGLLARLYSDRDGLVGMSNKFTAPDATFSFHAAGGGSPKRIGRRRCSQTGPTSQNNIRVARLNGKEPGPAIV